MSSIAVAHPPYQQALLQAQEAFKESEGPLEIALADKSQTGSIAQLTQECIERTKEMSSVKRNFVGYDELKDHFIQFTKPLLATYRSILLAQDLGLAAIRTLKQSQAECKQYKAKSIEMEQIMKHFTWMGAPTQAILDLSTKAEVTIDTHPFDENLTTLNALTATAAKKIKSLEAALNAVFYTRKVVEGKNGWTDYIPSFTNYYLLQEMEAEKQIRHKPATKTPVHGEVVANSPPPKQSCKNEDTRN